MDKADLWLKLFQEYAAEARHHEQQRATVTGFFSALAGTTQPWHVSSNIRWHFRKCVARLGVPSFDVFRVRCVSG